MLIRSVVTVYLLMKLGLFYCIVGHYIFWISGPDNMTAEALSESTMTFVEDKKNYYKQWIFDSPVLVQAGEYSEFEAIQSILYKLITHFVVNYQELKHLMPIDADAERVLAAFSSRPYNPGTYRTDFVYDAEGQAKLIEITCRFALNGVFFSSIFNNLADEYCESSASNLLRDDLSLGM